MDQDALDLTLAIKDSNLKKPELNLLGSLRVNAAQPPPFSHHHDHHSHGGGEVEPSRDFSCNYCQKKFSNSQALGAHQNAHKRGLCPWFTPGMLFIPGGCGGGGIFASMAALPLHGTYNRSLGIQPRSMIHKTTSTYFGPLYRQSATASARRPVEQQPAVGRLAPENYKIFSPSSGGWAAVDHCGGKGPMKWENGAKKT